MTKNALTGGMSGKRFFIITMSIYSYFVRIISYLQTRKKAV